MSGMSTPTPDAWASAIAIGQPTVASSGSAVYTSHSWRLYSAGMALGATGATISMGDPARVFSSASWSTWYPMA